MVALPQNLFKMNIHEYQGKAILKSYGVKVQEGILADNVSSLIRHAMRDYSRKDFKTDACTSGLFL